MPPPLPAGFAVPDFSAPLDFEEELRSVPVSSTTKGMFLSDLLAQAARVGRPIPGRGPYVAFKDYADREHVGLLADVARAVFPNLPLRESLRRLGQGSYDALSSSLIGKVVFGVLGKDIHALTRLTPKAYSISGKGTVATIVDSGDDFSHVALEGQVALADCYHFGAFEGVLDFCGVTGTVTFQKISASRVELFTTWTNKAKQ